MKRFHVRSSADMVLAESGAMNSACFWKMRYVLTNPKRDIALYLSPDGRYLAPVLYDLKTDPLIDERERQAETANLLSAGEPPAMGAKNAPVTIVEFSDFECPFCRRAAEMLEKEILPENGDGVRIVFRNFPLAMHDWANSAAQMAACAGLQKPAAFWRVHDFLFANQATLNAENLKPRVLEFVAQDPSLDKVQYDTCLEKDLTMGLVQKDMDLARKLGVRATPTIFVNGARIEGVKDAARIRELIAAAKGTSPEGPPMAARSATLETLASAPDVGGTCKKGRDNAVAQ